MTDDRSIAPRLLKELLDSHFPDPSARRKAQERIAGIGGAVKGHYNGQSTAEDIEDRLRLQFAKPRPFLPVDFVADPRFEPWLRARAKDLLAGWRAREAKG